MKRLTFILLLLLFTICTYAQIIDRNRKIAPDKLKMDLAYLQQQLYTVHVFPFTQLNKKQYDKLFNSINAKLTDSLTETGFLKLIKPAIAYLCDEHAQAGIPRQFMINSYANDAIFLPITLSKQGHIYRVEKVLSAESELKPGDIIESVNNISIKKLIDQCALFSSGYPEQRLEKALQQFGYLYTWTLPTVQYNYIIKTNNGKEFDIAGIKLDTWSAELNRQTGWDNACSEKISYQRINSAGYINACSFNISPNQLDSIHRRIDEIFDQVLKDDPKFLFIDISKNGGGQSVVGKMIIDDFNDKPYLGFSSDFKKSEAYLKLLKSWKVEPDDYYKAAPEGKVFHFNADTTYPGNPNMHRYKGRVILIVGNGTFSSAMMMATWVKDNHIATIVGETPMMGHPNGFGEMYNTKLPNSQISVLFGVKRWIRPSGDLKDNLLRPDIEVKLSDDKETLIKNVLGKLY